MGGGAVTVIQECEPSDYDTAEGLYDEIDGLRAMLAIREAQTAALASSLTRIANMTWPDGSSVEGARTCVEVARRALELEPRWPYLAALLGGEE
jgi:hypothetical protein